MKKYASQTLPKEQKLQYTEIGKVIIVATSYIRKKEKELFDACNPHLHSPPWIKLQVILHEKNPTKINANMYLKYVIDLYLTFTYNFVTYSISARIYIGTGIEW